MKRCLPVSTVAVVLIASACVACSDPSTMEAHDAAGSADAPTPDAPPLGMCGTLPDTCGPERNRPCCERRAVPGGTFYREYDGTVFDNTSYPATVSAFQLDTYEVTVGRFRQFVNAGKGTQADPPAAGAGAHPAIADSGWDPAWNTQLAATTSAFNSGINGNCPSDEGTKSWTEVPSINENRAIGCITWYEAFAFCAWDGGRLPTEAESMFAASGGSLQRIYPWSASSMDATLDCNHATYSGCFSAGPGNVGSTTSPAGDGLWGHADLVGNASEWTLDYFAQPMPTPCIDCASVTTPSTRMHRGGSFATPDPRGAARAANLGFDRNSGLGVRCARS